MFYHPGQIVPVSGLYLIIDPYGRSTGYEVTVVKGYPFPPAHAHGYRYMLFDPAKHKR